MGQRADLGSRRVVGFRALLLLPFLLGGCATHRVAARSSATELAERFSGFLWPLPIEQPSSVTSSYGWRGLRHHDGLDIRGSNGDPIYAAGPGRVRFSGWKSGYGQTIIVDHGKGVTTLYAHASALYARGGDLVVRGQPIAAVGATGNASGNHLHFEISWAGRPLDPVPLLPLLVDD